MTEPTPDYAGLIAEAEAAQEWMRQPDWADNFSLGDMVDWLRQRPTSILPKLTTALRTLLERYEALERERTNLIETKREQIDRLNTRLAELETSVETLRRHALEWEGRAEAADARVKELEAESARLRERQAEADRVIDRLKLALQAERQKPMRCAACNGDGQVSRSYGYIPCDACNGRGF